MFGVFCGPRTPNDQTIKAKVPFLVGFMIAIRTVSGVECSITPKNLVIILKLIAVTRSFSNLLAV